MGIEKQAGLEVKFYTAEEMAAFQCPVCGYYCNGKGGYGCIDKPSLLDMASRKREDTHDER